MKTLKRFIVALSIVMGVVVWLSPFTLVQCASNPTITISNPPSGEVQKIHQMVDDVNNAIMAEGIMDTAGHFYMEYTAGTDTISITINMIDYNKLQQKNKQFVMQTALDAVHNCDVSRTNRNKIYSFIADTDESVSSLVRQLSNDVTADFAGAYSSFKPFSGTLGWILGMISLLMFILLGLTISIDIAYINLPFLQLMLGDASSQKKPKFVSLEAWSAVKESESKAGQEFKSPLISYMKTKTGQFVAIFICLLYLVSGQIYTLIANVMDMFQGFLK